MIWNYYKMKKYILLRLDIIFSKENVSKSLKYLAFLLFF